MARTKMNKEVDRQPSNEERVDDPGKNRMSFYLSINVYNYMYITISNLSHLYLCYFHCNSVVVENEYGK